MEAKVEETMEEKRGRWKVVDEHQQMEESNRIHRKYGSKKKTKLKEQHQKKLNIDLVTLEEWKQQVSDIKRKVTEVNAAKARAQDETAKSVEREKQMTSERDEVLKLVTQQEMDVALKESELETALQHVSNLDFVFGKESPDEGRDAKHWTLRTIQLILKLMVAGTPPASIGATTVAFVSNITPHIQLKQLPSICRISC